MRWLLLVGVHLLLRVIGLFLLAALLPLLPDTARKLPRAFDWAWGNTEDGIDGDPHNAALLARWPAWARRWHWLAWRNPVHNFSRRVGCPQWAAQVKHVGTMPSDYEGIAGRILTVAQDQTGRAYWQDYGCWKWPGLPYCVRWRFGWKFRPDAPAGYIAALAYYVHPFKKFGPRE